MLVGAREDGLKWATVSTWPSRATSGCVRSGSRSRGSRARSSWRRSTRCSSIGPSCRARASASSRRSLLLHGEAPLDDRARDEYCTYVSRLITRYPQINDVVIWNEPNLRYFWKPQYDLDGKSEAPARYVELLARCWDVLHTLRPSVNVVAPAASTWGNDNPNAFSNVSHSPTSFIKEMGAVYRASGRTRPDLRHVRPPPVSDPVERASLGGAQRRGNRLARRRRPPDRATARGVRGHTAADAGQRPPIWYLETGYQTLIDDDKQSLYDGVENWPGSVPDVAPPSRRRGRPTTVPAPDQATQLADSLRMMYCQPHIAAVFNFLIRGRAESRRVAVRGALGGRVAQGLLRRLSLDRARGERAARRLRQAQGGARRAGWPEYRRQAGCDAGRDPLADQDHLPQSQARALRLPATPCAAHPRADGDLERPRRESRSSSCSTRPRSWE